MLGRGPTAALRSIQNNREIEAFAQASAQVEALEVEVAASRSVRNTLLKQTISSIQKPQNS